MEAELLQESQVLELILPLKLVEILTKSLYNLDSKSYQYLSNRISKKYLQIQATLKRNYLIGYSMNKLVQRKCLKLKLVYL